MNTVMTNPEPRLKAFRVTEDEIIASLIDGRTISVPLVWSWRLSEATPEQRNYFEILGDGLGVHWPALDEDISVAGMLAGMPALRPTEIVRRDAG
uniref:DUF2442 domain-containing protein n=2 Tax=Candidatus Kentrum TaxID=2126330 RepID=A0A450U9Y4_9GAMM|nr:MAG: Protein of unknown function (DUF2442) [Candidatus Kentron sp. H]VFJ88854.1 MAG: Protein of unknown function (DUF2442) [Candidatus Kentron sp. H]VFJ95102.1 MAG: Protein of unknown function (DUF2442) [Candidatus Kentron sp. H]VFK63536.1 MAG: Protein of unknown function (DUF2442) [Candidatus Kentron sp. UNK]VFK70858.1 MAG: Protein of unknown function (DUF2442) [Candidatus Kentron sp. UNK]